MLNGRNNKIEMTICYSNTSRTLHNVIHVRKVTFKLPFGSAAGSIIFTVKILRTFLEMLKTNVSIV